MNPTALAGNAAPEASRTMVRQRMAALGVSACFLVGLFALWPYQHWIFEHRGSVLEGWWRVLTMDANADWQFCLLVPIITGWLVHRQREELARLPLQGSWSGGVVLLFSAVVYWFGYKVDTGYLGFAAIQCSIAGLILVFGGTAWMRALFLPWLFLAFAWPFFPADTMLAARLKIPTAQLASQILALTGVDVVREGSMLQSAADPASGLPQGARFRLDVADSCSGMRSLYALIMTGVLYAIIGLRRSWPRVILACSAVPLAVAGNAVRLLLLAWGSLLFGQEWAVGRQVDGRQEESFFHILAGFIVFGVALGGMFGLATLLEGRRRRKRGAAAVPDALSIRPSVPFPAALAVVSVAAVLAVGLCWATPTSPNLAEPGIKIELPPLVGDHPSEELAMSDKERRVFDEGVRLVRRRYFGPDGNNITATLVLSGTVKKTLHTPERCLPDAGWTITRTEVVPVPLAGGGTINASLMHVQRDVRTEDGRLARARALQLYWYHGSQGVSTPGYDMHNFITYRDAIFRNLNHRWSQVSFFVMVPSSALGISGPLEEIAAAQDLIRFAGQVSPHFVKP